MSTFFAMGGYGVFVWASYGLTALVLGVLALASHRQARRTRQRLDSLRPARRRTTEQGRN
ncbi:heme exporter protein CcmD [Yunchengibacter salinarum]|uniref:heme exporter protein CcmD n=1 Tax=Yunchengibacter salinarum TaxID=3133399 RepID=UPI0035B6AA7B